MLPADTPRHEFWDHDADVAPPRYAAFWLIVSYVFLSALCYLPILDILAARLPPAWEFAAPLGFLLGPPLTLAHGTKYLTWYVGETALIYGLMLASWALYRNSSLASILLVMFTCVIWIGCAVLAVGLLI
jgi:hypothetical protein